MLIKKALLATFIISTLSAPIKASSYMNQKNLQTDPPSVATCEPFPDCGEILETTDIDKTSENPTSKSDNQTIPAPKVDNLLQDLKNWWETLFDL